MTIEWHQPPSREICFMCEFRCVLRHIVCNEGLLINPKSCNRHQYMLTPIYVTKIKWYLGITRFYQKCLWNFFNTRQHPCVNYSKGKNFEWINTCAKSVKWMEAKSLNHFLKNGTPILNKLIKAKTTHYMMEFCVKWDHMVSYFNV